MEDAKEMLLSDAIETAIKSEKKIIILKRIVSVLGIIVAVLTLAYVKRK